MAAMLLSTGAPKVDYSHLAQAELDEIANNMADSYTARDDRNWTVDIQQRAEAASLMARRFVWAA
jgi:predicted subunit of tRNA(5-methylaminomethyl-2-thiouridylate) methyltransferase